MPTKSHFAEASPAQAGPADRLGLMSREASFWVVALLMFLIIVASSVPTRCTRFTRKNGISPR
jgi:hypothetical protein